MRYLRSKNNGAIFEWDDILADSPVCEEISEEQAFPERFVEAVLSTPVARARKNKLNLTTADIPEPPVYTDPELSAAASRGLP